MARRREVIPVQKWLRAAQAKLAKIKRLLPPSCVKCLPPGSRTRMTDEIGKGTGVLSPGDLNSNNNGETTASYAASYVSNTSSQNDADFIQDNSEYQWFLDYGYREGMPHKVSVLPSLSESYARGLLSSGLYDDLARNLDANLAEVDMENFCVEDIHSLLNTLPTMCDLQKGAESNSQGEMFASVTGLSASLMGKFDFDSSISPHSSSQGEDSAGSIDTMSICKSELLFSPVKESAVPGTINFSVDSLDSDIMLTCQANKDNYTIAFEGSTTMGSEDSEEYHDQGDSETTSTDSNNWSRTSRMMNPALAAVIGAEQRLLNSSLSSSGSGRNGKNGCGRPNCKQSLTSSHNNMARSDSTFTTWSKLKKPDSENPLETQQLSRHPSGNNNTTEGAEEEAQSDIADQTAVKSRSLPNLAKQQRQQQQRIRQQIRASLALSTSSSIESSCVKLYDVRCNGSPLTSSGASSCSGSKPAAGLNLVRLFMKQRSGSGTDHSTSVSDGWDSDSCVRSASGLARRNHNASKTVSFGGAGGHVKTPPNSPNVSALLGGQRQYQGKLQQPLSDLPIREEDPGESSADECRSAQPSTPSGQKKADLHSKKALVVAVSDAVEEVISHFNGASTPGECSRLGDSALTPAVANSVIGTLCPALYAVLSDGLLPNIATAFGDISNSVWQVVEASAQQGHMTRSLNELVLRLNSEDVFSEGLLKFNAFVFGLLNVRSVDAWMGYLRTRESILRKHYSPEGLLLLSLRAGPSYHALTDGLLAALRPLALLPFNLDLLFECRQLHQSLQRLGAAAATSPTSLLRLVRSIQNSVGQLTITEENSSNRGDSYTSDGPLPDLLELSASSTLLKRHSRSRQLRRPRSCVDAALDFSDSSSSLRKRWSGVQLGSKLSQALDRLLAEDAEEDFSDSLNATPATPQARAQSEQSTSEDATLVSQSSDMDHTDTDLSDRSGAAAKARRAHALGVGGKFRRLQMKWEKLSGSGCESRDQSTRPSPEASPTKAQRPRASFSGSARTSPAMSPVKSTSRSSLHSPGSVAGSTTSSTGSGGLSRIPRPVTSPVRPPTGIPLPHPHHRSATSPTSAQVPMRKPSLPPSQGKRASTVGARTSRVDQSQQPEHLPRSPATRPSSLPYSPVSSGRSAQRRANSASVSRPTGAAGSGAAGSARKVKPAPRYVRTIKHQLASDSGHLSFSTGERLSLVLEVDEDWLLCCRGDRKGLVRRSAVVATQDHSSRF
ncbi:hypothetical protein ONE63_003918 [Megalurothrips usitatus]|uniref:Iporin n=1 Tax=Megalurothrips usitatus TaxID=439358 RepID=A0AAV7X8F6_9NEOP|nr:hypothetical protein ONE63_003918 [Megalurothrips usitatus]